MYKAKSAGRNQVVVAGTAQPPQERKDATQTRSVK